MRYWTVLALGVACSGDDGDDVTLDGHSHHTDTDGGGMTADCDGAEPFVAGTSKTTSETGATVSIASAAPTPPDVGDNAWTLQIDDGMGPLEGLAVELTPWMPLHGHGLVPPDYTATDDGGGAYTLQTFDLIMPGLWEFTVRLDAAGTDEALFKFCAEG